MRVEMVRQKERQVVVDSANRYFSGECGLAWPTRMDGNKMLMHITTANERTNERTTRADAAVRCFHTRSMMRRLESQ